MMDEEHRAIVAAGEKAVERAVGSMQPRFKGNAESVFGALVRWLKLAQDLQIPDYAAKSRRRDKWLQTFWMREPHWAGVVNQLTLINAGRGWTMTGGRNQVRRFTTILHDANAGQGWRGYLKQQVQSYYVTDLNAVTEVGRAGRNGPLRALYHTDPARCELTGNPKTPLKYYPPTGRLQEWRANDFFRMAANPYSDEAFHSLGFCGTSMAFELVKLLYGIWMHDQEAVGARMPQGLLLLHGMDEYQWKEMLAARKADLDAERRAYFGGLYVLFSAGVDQLDYKMIALSQLPANFDRETFIDQCIYGYALVTGMDPSEFWPVKSGSLGRGREVETQHRKAMTKGASEFAVTYQEQLQKELPDSLLFEFEQRDAEGELLDAQVAQAWADVAATLAGSKTGGVALVDIERIPSYLVNAGVWPDEWTVEAEDTQATDTEEARSRPEVRRAAELFPDEPIVRYHWPSGKEVVLWDSGEDLTRRRVWGVYRAMTEAEAVGGLLDEEKEIYKATRDVFKEFAPEFLDEVEAGQEPDYDRFEKALQAALIAALAAIMLRRMVAIGEEIRIDFDPAELAAFAADWASSYSYGLVKGLTDTTRKVIQGAMTDFLAMPGMTEAELLARLEPAFGALRAQTIAITETTRANSQAVEQYATLLRERFGLIVEDVWITQLDERVCPICGPLHDQPKEIWSMDFPDGPPAHVRCRCDRELRILPSA